MNSDPVAFADSSFAGCLRMHTDLRLRRAATQRWNVAMLAVTIVNHLGGGEHERKLAFLFSIGGLSRLDEPRQWILTRITENFRKDFDLAGLRLKTLVAITVIIRFAIQADSAGLRTQIVEGQFERCKDRIKAGVDIAVPE